MAPTVVRARTAFQFYQAEKIGDVKKELGTGATMGTAMAELSYRWKHMLDLEKNTFFEKEAQDRERYAKESAYADAMADAEQHSRRNAQIAQEGEGSSMRGARVKIAAERAEAEEVRNMRKIKTMQQMDPEELEERRRIKAQKKAETLERQRLREEQERALKDRHTKLDKDAAKSAAKRLEYLLSQSSIFAKLTQGKSRHEEVEEEADAAKKSKASGSSYVPHHRENKTWKKAASNDEEVEDEEDDNSDVEHIFLTKQPACIKSGQLKPYQLEGLNWMIHLAEKGLNGILADEMGLGKTLQSISVLAYHWEYLRIQGPHLICVPKSTLSNWMNELARWCPSLRAIRFHGNREERDALVERYFNNEAAAHDGKRPKNQVLNAATGELEDDNSENPRAWDVCVSTYEVCNSEQKTLAKFAWKYLVIDEAHRLKNETSIFSKTVRSFNTVHRLLLTGTPLQNNLHELWALLNFLLPDIFASSDQFDEWFDLEIDDENAKRDMIAKLHKILRPFMIRRLKADVAKGLPPKTETLVMVGMSKMQKQLYKKLLLRDIDSITGNVGSKNKTAILNIVMQLRKCCGHPYLFEGVEDRTQDPLGEHLVENCGKLQMVDKLLRKLKERGSRVLIFTQMTRILDILEDYMVMRGYKYCRIDGNTAYEDRENAIDSFNMPNSEKFCFILSTRAGGLGINLQTADTCILYDSDWNPQADLQAQDRCHRLGQKKPVNIYRLVSENTVEEKIVERARQKLKLDAMVVQQGRLKDRDKVGKDEIMAAVRFGADTVFRSEESTITDEDIDVILERGKTKTKELAEKLQKADKGDLLDFRLDAGISAQTFEGVDYSDKDLRTQLRLLAADSVGKRERKPPPINYNPIMQPKKSMIVNNLKIKLPKSLRLPRMEDHHFYNRERLLELNNLEFQTYATLKQLGQLPSREFIDENRTLLPPELAAEKLELLDEGFGHWTRSQYFLFVKAAAKYGREDIASIAADMELPVEAVIAYAKAFWEYGPTELKKDEWERVIANVEKGEQKIVKKRKLSSLLSKFIGTFDDPRKDMIFANKGTAHFALEQDRALLCAVDKFGYGNWDQVREQLRNDESLLFQHTVQGMNSDLIGKRCDYRMRQMERELEMREKRLINQKPAHVIAAENAIEAIKEMEAWDKEALELEIRGEEAPPLFSLSEEAQHIMEERLSDRQPLIDRLREIEIQVRGCKKLADETRDSIISGAQYVNYSNITLKAGGPHTGQGLTAPYKAEVDVEAKIHSAILRVPKCGECKSCLDEKSRKLCVRRLDVRNKLILEHERELKKLANAKVSGKDKKSKSGSTKRKREDIPEPVVTHKNGTKKSKEFSAKKKCPRPSIGGEINRGNPLGNKRMAVPEELLPDLCFRVSARGTRERMKTINEFVRSHPETSIRQVTIKFSEVTTKYKPACVPDPEKVKGRAFNFFLRPRFYHLLPENERPAEWEKYAKADELTWSEERRRRAKEKAKKEQKMKDIMEEAAAKSIDSNADSVDADMMSADLSMEVSAAASLAPTPRESLSSEDDTEEEEPVKKKKSKKTKE